MTKHTPGPWATYATSTPEISIIAEKRTVAFACPDDDEADGETEANAALIAATPDMQAALRDLVIAAEAAGWDVDRDNAPILNAARAALAKAEGR